MHFPYSCDINLYIIIIKTNYYMLAKTHIHIIYIINIQHLYYVILFLISSSKILNVIKKYKILS